MRGQPDLMVLNCHKDFKGLCIEFKSPTNVYHFSVAQKQMKKRYVENGYAFILSNNYDKISKAILNNYSPKAKLILWNNPRDEVEGLFNNIN